MVDCHDSVLYNWFVHNATSVGSKSPCGSGCLSYLHYKIEVMVIL
jgi:hypothetical protein